MKRLRVLLVCLTVAFLCWSPGHHVHCSEQPSTGLTAQDSSPHTTQEEGADDKVEEEWQTQSSYSVGLETERATLEEQLVESAPYDDKHEQTVNIVEEEVMEEVPPAHELGPHQSEPHSEPDQQQLTQTQASTSTPSPLSPQTQAEVELPQPSATQDQAAAATASPADEPHGELQIDPNTEVPLSAEPNAPEPASPTSQTSPEPHSSALEVASAGAPLKNSSDSQCEVGSVALSSQPLASNSRLSSIVTVKPLENERTGTNPPATNSSPPSEDKQVVDPEGGTDPPGKEDIPTFDEWKKKVMEVEEKKSQSLHTSSNGSPHPVKKVQKNFKNNYASVECGAKILAANSEAKSTSAILMENMDLYMLNPCSNKIWFVIELCEPIQVKQLDIANFELFSSTPKDFLVSISDRYPTNKWIKLGTFHARDERTVQSFPLDEQLYAKYVKMFIKYMKVELLSHFGSEHFCPLSLIRVFGTSMVEEYDEIADSQYPSERVEYLDEDYDLHFLDYPPGYLPSEDKPSKNLLGSATNAILTMVNNIAANVLGGKPELEDGAPMEGNTSSGTENVTGVSTETLVAPTPTPIEQQAMLHTPVLDPTLVKEDSESVPESPTEESRIVILIEDEEEEPTPPTVTLLEEEEREEEERRHEEEAWEKESIFYCSHLKTLSCLASLQEHLHLYCSAALALQRLRRDRNTRASAHAQTHTSPTVPTPTQTSSPSSEKLPEAEQPTQSPQDEKIAPTDTVPAPPHVPEQLEPSVELSPDSILLEPSHTSPIPPHSFSDTSLSRPTPTQDVPETPPLTGEPQDSRPQHLEHVPESSSSSLSPSSTISMLTPTSDLLSYVTNRVELPTQTKEQPLQPLPTHTRPAEIPPPTELPTATPEAADPNRSALPEDLQHKTEAAEAPPLTPQEEEVEDILLSVPASQSGAQRTATDFYAEPQNLSELSHSNGNGNPVHGSNQKESVFMRLNNRIKALEMNMSLSSRYLEELSQRYRKQMEEMQRAFNKTIIKLQNTSRIAEEQDQKQTDSIQMLQSQLENVTKLMLNLSATVSQLQKEVSDRQSYLVVSLVLCLALGLLLCTQCCRSSSNHNRSSAIPVSNHYPSPKRCFSSYDDMSLKRRVSCPLMRSKSFQLPTSEVGPDDLYIVEPLRFSPEKKKKRCKTKGGEKAETLRASVAEEMIANGGPKNDSVSVPHFLPSTCDGNTSTCSSRDGVSEGSSEGSSSTSSSSSSSSSTASDESCCSVQCNGQLSSSVPPAKNREEKRSFKRRRSKIGEQQQQKQQLPPQPHRRYGAGLLHTPIPVATGVMPTLQELMKGKQELGVGAFGVTAAVTGRV
ncbi:SUN domain-containing ossification factor isoform X3 [Colossoma macropomum]|uniref:SUN domain-containing ossification factor isoform X3 n=1 Tax=Colossoma macropomum TaxID=42526 RepID=UPI001863FB69|nr:SUN domain-containing ossification factor isoform X3 [Colossoma macropomum]